MKRERVVASRHKIAGIDKFAVERGLGSFPFEETLKYLAISLGAGGPEKETGLFVGAHVGSVAMECIDRGICGKALCVEGDLQVFERLLNAIEANHFEELIAPLYAIVKGKSDVFKFTGHLREVGEGTNTGMQGLHHPGRKGRVAPCFTLNQLIDLAISPTLVVVDIEGLEYDVITGLYRSVVGYLPNLFVIDTHHVLDEDRGLTNDMGLLDGLRRRMIELKYEEVYLDLHEEGKLDGTAIYARTP